MNVSERYPGIPQRDYKQEQGEYLTESPFALFTALISLVALQRQFRVHYEEDVDQEEGDETDKEEGSLGPRFLARFG